MIPDRPIQIYNSSGNNAFQLEKLDLKQDHLPVNGISINKINYVVKASNETISDLKKCISETKFESFHEFAASLQENLGFEKESTVFINTINPNSSPSNKEAEGLKAISLQIDKLAEEKNFSGSALIANANGDILLEAYAGFANIGTKKVNSADTQFNIASIAKMFTAVAILQLLENDPKLSLDDPIKKFLSDEIPNKKMQEITIRQLLTHTGGTGKIEGDFRVIQTPKGFIDVTKNNDPLNPGECSYSNLGFVLLGAIIENVSNKDYYTYVQENIFKVAEMKNSDYHEKTDHRENTAIGYMGKNNALLANQDNLPFRGLPSGMAYSTGQDLLAFSKALQNKTLLKEDSSLELIKTYVKTTNDKVHPTDHSTGFMTGEGWFGHTGHYDGANGELRIYPEYTVCILANRDQDQASNLADFIHDELKKI